MASDPPGYDDGEFKNFGAISRMRPIRPTDSRKPSRFMQMRRQQKTKQKLQYLEDNELITTEI